ncbi:MAG: hypothetical protein HYV33_01410 [Candidatus Kerfeldbacteria bacterium]|nr:hypothetical protein [Candidatus Kerfeldbacteria bacterium]
MAVKHWNFTIIAVLGGSVLSFVFGYTYHANRLASGSLTNTITAVPDVTGDILSDQVRQALVPDSGIEAVLAPSELHAYTGYVRAIKSTELIVEKPDATTTWPDQINFILTDTTRYSTLDAGLENNLPVTTEQAMTLDSITVGDIVTVYTNEDIYTAELRVATKVQKIIR